MIICIIAAIFGYYITNLGALKIVLGIRHFVMYALEEAGVPVESHALEGMPHGFGVEGG